MKLPLLARVLAALLVLPSGLLRAQASNVSGSESSLQSADVEWAALQKTPRTTAAQAVASDAASAKQARAAAIVGMVAEADLFRDFYTKNPRHSAATEAKLREADALLRAKALGETASDSRRTALVGTIRRDATIPVALRAPVAAFSDNLEVMRTPGLDADARLRAFESTARALNREFPEMPDGYRSLLQIARRSADARAQAIAAELAKSDAAPAEVRKEAELLLKRHALVGRPLREVAGPLFAIVAPEASREGRAVAIYTWASFDPAGLALAKRLAAAVPKDIRVVGLCLDRRRLDPAKKVAQEQGLPGELVYDWLGQQGELAELLGLDEVGLVLLADGSGIVRTVSAQRNLPAALATLAKP